MKKYFKQFFWSNIFVISIYLLFAILANISPLIFMKAFDELLQSNIRAFLILMSVKIILSVIMLFMNYSRNVQKAKVTTKMQTALRRDLAKKLETCSYSTYNKEKTGAYISWFNNDVQIIDVSGFSAVYDAIDFSTMALFALVTLFYINWSIGALSIVLSFIAVFAPKIFQKKMTDAVVQFSIQKEIFITQLKDALGGFDVLFSFNLRNRITNNITAASEALADKQVYQVKKVILPAIMLSFFSMAAGLIVLVFTGVLSGYHIVNISAVAAILGLTDNLFSSLTNILTRTMNIKTVYALFNKFKKIDEPVNPAHLQTPEFKKSIKVENLKFAYEAENFILQNLNMEFEIGKKYGIIGESGSGKTTLFKLLTGMLENFEGKIKYDGTDITSLSKEELREQVTYIDQNVYIFDKSIRENICLDNNFTDEELNAALDKAALTDFISELENGIETQAGENGKNFSGGQKQRIALARAIIHGRKILLIDEGTSSLDEKNAVEIERKLLDNPDLTVIMVSHHFENEIKEKFDAVYTM